LALLGKDEWFLEDLEGMLYSYAWSEDFDYERDYADIYLV
jgi:hypothetical protein